MKETYTEAEMLGMCAGALHEFLRQLTDYTEKNWSEADNEMLDKAIRKVLKNNEEESDVQGSE